MNHLKNLAVIVSEAIKKPNATTRHLRQYPVSDKDVAKPVKPEKKKEEKKIVAEAVPYAYGFVKQPRKGSVAYNAVIKRKEQDRNRVKEIEAIGTKNHHVGVAKVTKEEHADQLDEISLGNYKEKAEKEVKELKPHAKGEYGDFAKKIIAKRKAGLQRAMRRESVKDDNSIPFDGPYTKVPNKQPQSKKPPGFSRAKHLAQLMKDRMSKIKEQNNLQEETDTAEHHFEKSLEHYHKADKALKDGDREKHDYHVAMGDVHKAKVDQHLSKTDFKHSSHIHAMSSHLFKHQQKHREIQRNQEWEDEKNQTIQRGHEYMQRAGERSNFEMKDGKLHRKPPKYDRNTGEKLNNEAYMGKVTLASNPREKWMKSVKDRGYDMRAGAKRLQDLLDKQKKERAEMEQRAKEKGLEY